MDFEALGNMGWREALIAIIALLVLYLVLAFLRIRRLKREPVFDQASAPLSAQPGLAAYASEQTPEIPDPPNAPKPTDSPTDSPRHSEGLAVPSANSFPWNEPPPEIPGQQRIEALERELAQLRKEVEVLRAEMLLLREAQRRDLAHSQVAQNASPLYNDAMQMAVQGIDPASIARHCGISRAEAELVAALVRNRD